MVVYWMTSSLDGFVETRDGKIDWTAPDDELFRFSKTLRHIEHNSRLAGPDIQAEVAALKQRTKGDLALGGATLAASFHEARAHRRVPPLRCPRRARRS